MDLAACRGQFISCLHFCVAGDLLKRYCSVMLYFRVFPLNCTPVKEFLERRDYFGKITKREGNLEHVSCDSKVYAIGGLVLSLVRQNAVV